MFVFYKKTQLHVTNVYSFSCIDLFHKELQLLVTPFFFSSRQLGKKRSINYLNPKQAPHVK